MKKTTNESLPVNQIVSDGPERLWKEKSTQERVAKIELEVQSKYAEEMKQSGFLKRLRLKIRIRREIETEIDKFFPKNGLYIRS